MRGMAGPGAHSVAQQRLGAALVLASTVPFALAGIFTKIIEADVWSVLAWRGLIGGVLIHAYALRWGSEGGRAMGWRGWVLALVGAVASFAFLAAFRLTAVANVTLIYAMAPFAAAILDRLIRGEPARPAVIRSAGLSALGVGIIVVGGLGGVRLAGDLMAVAMMVLFALYTVLIRAFPEAPAMRAGALSALPLLALGLVFGDPFGVGGRDMVWLCLFGLSFAAAVILFTEGARRIPAAETGLYGGAETPMAVLFAWLLLEEWPPLATWAGGSVVMAAVLWRGWRDLRR